MLIRGQKMIENILISIFMQIMKGGAGKNYSCIEGVNIMCELKKKKGTNQNKCVERNTIIQLHLSASLSHIYSNNTVKAPNGAPHW